MQGVASLFATPCCVNFAIISLLLHKKVVPLRRKMCFCVILTNLFN